MARQDIHYKGFEELNLRPLTEATVKNSVERAAKKFFHGDDCELTVHLKKYEKDGARAKYSANLRMEGVGKPVISTSVGWRAAQVIKDALINIEVQLEKRIPQKKGKPTRRKLPPNKSYNKIDK